MKPLPKLRSLALFALIAAALAFAPAAYAEDGEQGGGDLKKKIQEKMEKILQLMRDNEAALLKLSTGKAATTSKVDVKIPDEIPDGTTGKGSGSGDKSGGSSGKGEDAVKEIEKALESLSKKGGTIPDEIKQVVEMIPL